GSVGMLGDAEARLLFRDERSERRPLVHRSDVAGELRPARRIDAEAGVAEIHELGRDPDVADRELPADDERAGAELALEVVEDRRGVGERPLAVAERGYLAERADLPELGRDVDRNHVLALVRDALLGERDADLAHERGRVDAVQDSHASSSFSGWFDAG